MTAIVAIDPGLSGAVAIIRDGELVSVIDTPTMGEKKRRMINCVALYSFINAYNPSAAVVEMAQAMPGQGVGSTFRYGMAYGQTIAVLQCLEIPTFYKTAAQWKRLAGLDKSKENSRRGAIEAFPYMEKYFARKKDHNRAEAALLAKLYWPDLIKLGEVVHGI